jgi:sugar/nucleoside kinase (ribokinase family)
MDFVSFGVILDEVVLPDGRVSPPVLGGGGPQAAFGMRLWADRVGIAGGVGEDLPEAARQWFAASGIDTEGLRPSAWPTLRARQILDTAGHRLHDWQTPGAAIGPQLNRSLDLLPKGYLKARGFHFGVHPEEPDLEFAASLRRLGALVSIETFRPADRPLERESLYRLLSAPHIFSAALEEAESLVGPGSPRSLARRLIENGARIVALRLGAEGSLVVEGISGQGALIPAMPVHPINPVGAGNAYCGGFLAGWATSRDLATAGCYGAVAASFLLEQIGMPVVDDEVRAEARQRLGRLAVEAVSM